MKTEVVMNEPFRRRTVTPPSVVEPPTQPECSRPSVAATAERPPGDCRTASPTTLGWMSTMALLGTGLVVGGWRVARSIPAWSYPRELRDRYCSGEYDTELFSGIGWLYAVWLLLAAVCVAATVLWRRAGVDDRRVSTIAIVGIVTTVLLCPIWFVMLTGMDCGM